jgi:chromosome segregation ATPase
MSQRFDLEATIAALSLGEVIGRRNYEGYREWAKLERDWLEIEELEHLKRATSFMRKRNRSLKSSLARTKDNADASESAPANERANLSEMARELRALRAASEVSRGRQDALIARLKTEDTYYAAWERRLRRAEDEMNGLWDVIEELIRLSSASAPRLEKLKKRVGFQFLRFRPSQPAKPAKETTKAKS